jgi:hypothetical protein
MIINEPLLWPALALALASTPLHAQENERAVEQLEITMTLLPEQAENASQVIQRIIELPPPPATPTGENGRGAEDAPGAERGRGEGLETAAEARERGREFGQSVAADARENRENAGRGAEPPGRPEDLPGGGPPVDPPGPPIDPPGPPQNPGRP